MKYETRSQEKTVKASSWLLAGSLVVFSTVLLRAATGKTPPPAPDRLGGVESEHDGGGCGGESCGAIARGLIAYLRTL